MRPHTITVENASEAMDAVKDILLLYAGMAESYSGFGHASNVHLKFDPLKFVDAELLTPEGYAPLLDLDFLRTGSAMAVLCQLYQDWCEFETVDGGRHRSAILEGRLRFAPDIEAVAKEALRRGAIPLDDLWFDNAVEPIYQRYVVGHFEALSKMHRRAGGDSLVGARRSATPWWRRLFRGRTTPTLANMAFTTFCVLYSADGKRQAEVLVFANGQTYLRESEQVDGGTFENRHGGSPVGPFASPEAAERFIVATAWFRG